MKSTNFARSNHAKSIIYPLFPLLGRQRPAPTKETPSPHLTQGRSGAGLGSHARVCSDLDARHEVVSNAPDLAVFVPEKTCRREEEQSPTTFPQARIVAIDPLQDRSDTVDLPVEISKPVEGRPAIM